VTEVYTHTQPSVRGQLICPSADRGKLNSLDAAACQTTGKGAGHFSKKRDVLGRLSAAGLSCVPFDARHPAGIGYIHRFLASLWDALCFMGLSRNVRHHPGTNLKPVIAKAPELEGFFRK